MSVLTFTGYDDCVIGVAEVWDTSGSQERRVVYSGERIIKSLMRDGMTDDEAQEFLDFNIQGAYVGPQTPIIVWKVRLKDLDS